MLGKFDIFLKNKLIFFYYSSEFVSTRIIHDLYQLCCSKRFTANAVEKLPPIPRRTLYKYLVIPKEGQQPPPTPKIEQPKTPDYETRPTTNPFAQHPIPLPSSNDQHPPEIKRRITHNPTHTEHEIRPRSGTLPFIEHTEPLQYISTMRSGNGLTPARPVQYQPKYDEQEEEEEKQ